MLLIASRPHIRAIGLFRSLLVHYLIHLLRKYLQDNLALHAQLGQAPRIKPVTGRILSRLCQPQ